MKEVSVQEAFELMQSDPEHIYLDVRSTPEFEAGHPERAINIPLLHLDPNRGMAPNPDFAAVVSAALPKDAKILVGCKSGGHSASACQLMRQMGYNSVANVRGGFGGQTDNFGRVIEPGWSMLNLPSSTEAGASERYDALLAKVKQA